MGEDSLQQIQPGQLIAERYLLEEPIGHGAMGAVWRAWHVRLESPVAIKLLNSAIADDPEMLERFLREARSAAAVRSSHVVQIFDYGVDRDVPYIAMELLVGEPLDARLDARGVLEPQELDKIFTEIARAVSNAHAQGVVHRDIKPANIFIAREGDLEVTKVLDFGIAKLLDQRLAAPVGSGTHTGNILGTPNYMSPEQARGQRQVDHRSDLWALAVLAFECLTGRQPFESATLGDLVVKICTAAPTVPSSLAPVPAAFDAWFLKGTNKDPAGRFRSALEMADELHALLSAEGLGADSRQRSSTDRRFPPDKVDPARGAAPSSRGPGSGRSARGPRPEATVLTTTGAIATEVSPPPTPSARRLRYALVAGVLLLAGAVLALGPGRALFAGSAPASDDRPAAGASAPSAPNASAEPSLAGEAPAPTEVAPMPTAPAPAAAASAPAAPARVDAPASAPVAGLPTQGPQPAASTPRGEPAAPAAGAAAPEPRAPTAARAASTKPPRVPAAARVERPTPPKPPAQPAAPAPPDAPKPAAPFDPYSDRL
jgi:serine/threonine-protein kinase